jgi:hypothetical protein
MMNIWQGLFPFENLAEASRKPLVVPVFPARFMVSVVTQDGYHGISPVKAVGKLDDGGKFCGVVLGYPCRKISSTRFMDLGDSGTRSATRDSVSVQNLRGPMEFFGTAMQTNSPEYICCEAFPANSYGVFSTAMD